MSGRIRIEVTGGPWRERIGQRGWIVADPGDGVYPFTRRMPDEVVIVLDADPLRTQGDEPRLSNGERWTCCLGMKDVMQIGGPQ